MFTQETQFAVAQEREQEGENGNIDDALDTLSNAILNRNRLTKHCISLTQVFDMKPIALDTILKMNSRQQRDWIDQKHRELNSDSKCADTLTIELAAANKISKNRSTKKVKAAIQKKVTEHNDKFARGETNAPNPGASATVHRQLLPNAPKTKGQ